MKTFEHNFKTAFGIVDLNGVNGYLQCLQAIYNHIKEVTDFKPQNRYIDAVPILDKIAATNNELMILTREAEKELKNDLTEMDLELISKKYLS